MNARKPLTLLMALVVLCLAAFTAAGCGSSNNDSTPAPTGSGASGSTSSASTDIVATAAGNKDLATLVSLVKLGGLVQTLQGSGPYTVFAPTNAAFAKLDPKTVAALKKPANKDQLKQVLTYHVVAGDYSSQDIVKLAQEGKTLKTVEGEDLTPELDGSTVKIKDANGNTATVVKADVTTSNGVVHVIDGVLIPKG